MLDTGCNAKFPKYWGMGSHIIQYGKLTPLDVFRSQSACQFSVSPNCRTELCNDRSLRTVIGCHTTSVMPDDLSDDRCRRGLQRSTANGKKLLKCDSGCVTLHYYLRDTVAIVGLSVWGAVEAWFWVGGIQSEQLQVSYYEPYYASLCFWCLESKHAC